MDHPGHMCPLLLDDDIDNAIHKKLPQPAVFLVVSTVWNTINVSHIDPRTRIQAQQQDPSLLTVIMATTDAPCPTNMFDWQAQEKLCDKMIQTVRVLQEPSPTELVTPQHTKVNTSATFHICNNIL